MLTTDGITLLILYAVLLLSNKIYTYLSFSSGDTGYGIQFVEDFFIPCFTKLNTKSN